MIKKLLSGLSLSVITGISSLTCAPLLSNTPQNNLSHYPASSLSYENNNSSLEDHVIVEALEGVEQLIVETNYITQYFNGERGEEIGRALGAGTIIDVDKDYQYILTANHLVDAEKEKKLYLPFPFYEEIGKAYLDRMSIKIYGKETGKIEVLLKDKELDFAYLRVPKSALLHKSCVKIGDSSKIKPGDYVYLVGFPYGIEEFVAEGIIGAKDAPSREKMEHYFPRDKSLLEKISNHKNCFILTTTHRGDSGGPIFAVHKGELYLIGTSSWMASTKSEEGYGALGFGMKITPIIEKINRYKTAVKKH